MIVIIEHALKWKVQCQVRDQLKGLVPVHLQKLNQIGMKDFDPQHPQDNQVTTAEQRQVRTEKHVASLRIHPGHRVYEFDLSTGVIAEAHVESINATFGGGTKKKVIQREQCLYAPALNGQNAIRKFAKMYERLVQTGHIVRHNQN